MLINKNLKMTKLKNEKFDNIINIIKYYTHCIIINY